MKSQAMKTVLEDCFQDPSEIFINIHENIAERSGIIPGRLFMIDLVLTRCRFLSFQSTDRPPAIPATEHEDVDKL
jgi:hypothetical protein